MDAVSNPTFDAVLAAAKAGDSIAFEQLYRMLNRRVASFATARCAIDPDGVVNDVFVRVFKGLPAFEGNEDQFISWVFRIARNRLIDESRYRQRRVDELLMAEQPTSRAATAVDEEVLSKIEGERLLRQLDCLTDDQRDVVLLRVVADQSLEVVAATLGKSVGAIKSIQGRALRTLARTHHNQDNTSNSPTVEEIGRIQPEAVSR